MSTNNTTPIPANPQPTEAQSNQPATSDTGHATAIPAQPEKTGVIQNAQERNDLSAVNAPAQKPLHDHVHLPAPSPIRGTAENDAAVAQMYPQLGDEVEVNVELVPYEDRTLDHQRIIQHSVHGRRGTVIGQEIVGGKLFLRIENSAANVLVPADAVAHATPLPQEQAMQEPRQSPERMRKPNNGSYNLT